MVRIVDPDARTVKNEAIYKLNSSSRLLDRPNLNLDRPDH